MNFFPARLLTIFFHPWRKPIFSSATKWYLWPYRVQSSILWEFNSSWPSYIHYKSRLILRLFSFPHAKGKIYLHCCLDWSRKKVEIKLGCYREHWVRNLASFRCIQGSSLIKKLSIKLALRINLIHSSIAICAIEHLMAFGHTRITKINTVYNMLVVDPLSSSFWIWLFFYHFWVKKSCHHKKKSIKCWFLNVDIFPRWLKQFILVKRYKWSKWLYSFIRRSYIWKSVRIANERVKTMTRSAFWRIDRFYQPFMTFICVKNTEKRIQMCNVIARICCVNGVVTKTRKRMGGNENNADKNNTKEKSNKIV